MGREDRTETTDRAWRRRIPGVVTGIVLVVALGAAATLIALQRAHTSSANGPGTQQSSHPTTTVPPHR